MNAPSLPHAGPLAIDLNQPGTYLHWSIFTVSVANLALIAVMVVIFGAALLLPFPRGRAEAAVAPARPAPGGKAAAPASVAFTEAEGEDAWMWTGRVRRIRPL